MADLDKNRFFVWNKEGCRENKIKCRIYNRGMHHYSGTSVLTRQMNLDDSKNYVFNQTERSLLVMPFCHVILKKCVNTSRNSMRL